MPGGFLGDPSLVAWQAGAHPTLGVGQYADFWFTTAPTALAYTNGIVAGPAGASLVDSPAGLLVVPILAQAGPPQAPPPAILVATEVDKNTPNVGLTSLREAIDAVNRQTVAGLSQVRFTDGMHEKTITLGALGSLDITRTVTIQTTTFSGQERDIKVTRNPAGGDFSLFTVTGLDVLIEGLSLTGGGGGPVANVMGGAVRSSGGTALMNCDIYENDAPSGGGVYSDGDWLSLVDCQVYRNRANGLGVGEGGGIYVAAGSLWVEDCNISLNTATTVGGGIALGDGVTTADILGSFISGNRSFETGGGIYVEGGTQFPTLLWVGSTTITSNAASADGGGIAVGGEERMVAVTLDFVNLTYNRAGVTVQGNGGGVYLGSGTLWTDDLIVTGNSAEKEGVGGGFYLALGTTWTEGPNPSLIVANSPDDVFFES